MSKVQLPTLEMELSYLVDAFIDENDRQPTLGEFAELCSQAHETVDSAKEAYEEYVARGAFECAVCERTHYHHAPPACCRAYSSGEF